MFKRLALAGAQRYFGGSGKSWVVTSGIMVFWRAISSMTGRRETLDLSNTKPGDMIVIEHLPITHKAQIKQFKKQNKVIKGEQKAAKRAAKMNRTSKQSPISRIGKAVMDRPTSTSPKPAKAVKVSKPSRKAMREDKRDRRAAKRDARAQRRDKRQAKKVQRHKDRVASRSQKLARRAVRLEQRAARTSQRASNLK